MTKKINIKVGDEFWFYDIFSNDIWKDKVISMDKFYLCFNSSGVHCYHSYWVGLEFFNEDASKNNTIYHTEKRDCFTTSIRISRKKVDVIKMKLYFLRRSKDKKVEQVEELSMLYQQSISQFEAIEQKEIELIAQIKEEM